MISGSVLDTIVAPATPIGRSALAIIRIDGPSSGRIAATLCQGKVTDERTATHVELWDGEERIDDAVIVRYVAPRSFTGNDLVELTLHGNPLIIDRLIRAVVGRGGRIAERGEFTERAVLNGKLDLVQAESIGDLIAARTPLQAKLSLDNLEGRLSRTGAAIRAALLDVISRLEAALDFADEGYEFIARDEARQAIASAIASCESLLDTFRRGFATTEGLSAVILGLPNAGKSTLLNRLVGSDRAIVTPIPGTTRDIVRETIEIGGLPVTLADTAGLRESSDEVEGIGIERARTAARNADIVIYLIDASLATSDADRDELSRLSDKDTVIVYTKTDLQRAPAGERGISAKDEKSFDEFLASFDTLVRERFAIPEDSATLVNERQRTAVSVAADSLRKAIESLDGGQPEEMVLVDLYAAANAIGLLTGTITHDEIFDEIFKKFCIGK